MRRHLIKQALKVFLLLLLIIGFVALYFLRQDQLYAAAHPPSSFGPTVELQLKRGPFTVYNYLPEGKPLAIILFGSGDGGWLGWEDTVGKGLSKRGFQVIGIDSNAYAKSDYDLATLQADFSTIARTFRASYWMRPPPVILGGWSMGAAQAVAAAGGPHAPRGLAGLLVVSLYSRGRYGIRMPDRVDIIPTGAGTFSIDDFARTMEPVRVVQMHAGEDFIDSRSWLVDLKGPHRECDVPGVGHAFNGADDPFLEKLAVAARWIDDEPSPDFSAVTP